MSTEFDFEEIIAEIEDIEQGYENNFEWIMEERIVETRSRRDYGINTESREYVSLEVRGYALDVEITKDEIKMPYLDGDKNHLTEMDRELFEYLSGLR